jgi:hypothetical protein
MHLCIQDYQIGPKIVVLAPADMARQPPSIITKKLVVNYLVCQLGLLLFKLALLDQGNRPFLLVDIFHLVLRFLWFGFTVSEFQVADVEITLHMADVRQCDRNVLGKSDQNVSKITQFIFSQNLGRIMLKI